MKSASDVVGVTLHSTMAKTSTAGADSESGPEASRAPSAVVSFPARRLTPSPRADGIDDADGSSRRAQTTAKSISPAAIPSVTFEAAKVPSSRSRRRIETRSGRGGESPDDGFARRLEALALVDDVPPKIRAPPPPPRRRPIRQLRALRQRRARAGAAVSSEAPDVVQVSLRDGESREEGVEFGSVASLLASFFVVASPPREGDRRGNVVCRDGGVGAPRPSRRLGSAPASLACRRLRRRRRRRAGRGEPRGVGGDRSRRLGGRTPRRCGSGRRSRPRASRRRRGGPRATRGREILGRGNRGARRRRG